MHDQSPDDAVFITSNHALPYFTTRTTFGCCLHPCLLASAFYRSSHEAYITAANSTMSIPPPHFFFSRRPAAHVWSSPPRIELSTPRLLHNPKRAGVRRGVASMRAAPGVAIGMMLRGRLCSSACSLSIAICHSHTSRHPRPPNIYATECNDASSLPCLCA